ncbi:MAG: ATP-binding protein [Sphingobacteriales bacterium]|nr:MAG: ATP-binding protein [Sphingobacteriales bacterium]
MVSRDIKAEIIETLENFPAVMLYGPRQIGKTTLAKQISADFSKKGHYFDLEKESDFYALQTNAYDLLQGLKDDIVVLDEVQHLPKLLSSLRNIIDEHRVTGRFILLGSADPQLVEGVSESLAGRVIYTEVSQIHLLEAIDTNISQSQHWFRGGFPEALLLKSDKMWLQWVQSFIQTYVYRDINQLFNINLSPQIILKLWGMLAHIHSGIENMEDLARSIGITGTSVKKYVDYMQGAYLIRRLQPWYINNGKRLVKSPKIYIRTQGILHYLLNIHTPLALQTHPSLGASWEGYVIEQIWAILPSSLHMYYYRTHHGAEIDVVLVKQTSPIAAIEIKYADAPTLSKGFYEAIHDLSTTKNYVITPHAHTVSNAQGIIILSLKTFLETELNNIGK